MSISLMWKQTKEMSCFFLLVVQYSFCYQRFLDNKKSSWQISQEDENFFHVVPPQIHFRLSAKNSVSLRLKAITGSPDFSYNHYSEKQFTGVFSDWLLFPCTNRKLS